ncbi:MAG TPA: FUSC family protein [Acidimicrobiales bacterium]|nr:FUSC family protein [Acidimicrobiales bacterium]
MTQQTAAVTPTPARPGVLGRIRARDPDLLVLKRSVRAAVIMPVVFALAHTIFSNPQVALFAAFGSFALLLLVEFTGRPHARLASYGGLFVVGACFTALGTAVSTNKVAAVATMAVVGFAVLFAGIVAPQAATATTAALLTFVLPVAVAQPVSAIGPRLIGWAIAGVACIAGCMFVWPPPWHDNLRRRLASAVSAVARLAYARSCGADTQEAYADVATELQRLSDQFSGTPYPPTGAAAGAAALSKLVGRVEWVADNTVMIRDEQWSTTPLPARAVTEQVAETLHQAAAVICDGEGHPIHDPTRIASLQEAARKLDRLMTVALEADVTSLTETEAVPDSAPPPERIPDESIAGALDPGFHARALGIATEVVADAALEAAGAEPVGDRRMGMGDESAPQALVQRLLSHLSFRSVWFRNALRGAVGLALAVAVVEVTNVQHGFWVVLGTMSVLRSSALGTGATALRAVGGTAVGFVVGSAIMIGVADHRVLLWVLLPLAVLLSGLAPLMISFAAGQAAFTLVVIILFNIIQPTGWKVGLTRIEDVAIGCAVSIVVGLLFWPRGATAALGRALSTAFATSSAYLADAVERLTVTRRHVDTDASQQASHRAYLLCDDAFRQFFAERGAKVVSVETISRLFTGSNRLRLAAFTLGTYAVRPPDAGQPEVESVTVAEAVLRDAYAANHRWYERFADLLADRTDVLDEPPPHGEVLHDVLRQAFEDVRDQQRSDRVQTTLQMLWADELLENQAQMQKDLQASADLFVRGKRLGRLI